MFNKKIKCMCGKKIDKDYVYCPHCGNNLKQKPEKGEVDFNDFVKEFNKSMKMPFFLKFPFEKIMKNMVGEIDKQFHEYDRELSKTKRQDKDNVVSSGISISISTSPNGEPSIQVRQFGKDKPIQINEKKEIEKKFVARKIDEKEAERISKLPREEPITKVRRLTDKIIYEVEIPGVKNIDNVIINKLQNSIEVKAFTKNKAYFKLIPLSFPIKNYFLKNDVLTIELKPV